MAYEAKTKPTDVDARAFIDRAEPARRRVDGHALCDLMGKVSGTRPVMWGPSMVGFGASRYRYDSGHSGETFRIGFAPRRTALVLYLPVSPDRATLLERLGRHSTGVGCLYIKTLADVDIGVLEQLVASAWTASEPAGAS